MSITDKLKKVKEGRAKELAEFSDGEKSGAVNALLLLSGLLAGGSLAADNAEAAGECVNKPIDTSVLNPQDFGIDASSWDNHSWCWDWSWSWSWSSAPGP